MAVLVPTNHYEKELPPFIFAYLLVLNHKPILEQLSKQELDKVMKEPGILGCLERVKNYFQKKSNSIPKLLETREFFNSYIIFDNDDNAKNHLEKLEKIYTEKCACAIWDYIVNFPRLQEKKNELFEIFDSKMEFFLKS